MAFRLTNEADFEQRIAVIKERFASTLMNFERSGMQTALQGQIFSTNMLFWYAEALRASGREAEARPLVKASVWPNSESGRILSNCLTRI